MYNAFFEFEENPFSPQPDPAFFYRSKQHDMSLRSLAFAVQARMGLSSLVGEEGTGKTMLLECLRGTLESAHIPCAYLRDSRISPQRFFQAIASDLDLRCQGTSAYQVFATLLEFALQQARKGSTVALIVDDAHNLPAEVLKEILHFASLHDHKVKLLQTVLAGRLELHAMLDALNLERLSQRAILSCHLDPLTIQETERYVQFRLKKAGLPAQAIFPPEAMAEIFYRSGGFPPAIHTVCEQLLLAAFSDGSKVCTPDILDRVLTKPHFRPSDVAETLAMPRLIAPPEPEPPALGRLVPLAFTAIWSMPPPLPVKSQGLESLCVEFGLTFPRRTFVLPLGEFATGSKTPMRLTEPARIVSHVHPANDSIASVFVVARPVFSMDTAGVELRPMGKLRSIHPGEVVGSQFTSHAPATPIDFPVAVSPVENPSPTRLAALTPKGVNTLARLSCKLKPISGIIREEGVQESPLHIPIPPGAVHAPNLEHATEADPSISPRVSDKLVPLACSVLPRPALPFAPAGVPSCALPLVLSAPPTHPAVSIQPAGTARLPRVPVMPFRIAECIPPVPRIAADSQAHLLNLQNPVGPRMDTDLPRAWNVPGQSGPLHQGSNLRSSAPKDTTPIATFLHLLPSLQPCGPVSGLEPVDPRKSWLLLLSWKPEDSNPLPVAKTVAVETSAPLSSRAKWLLGLAIPVLAGLTLYGLSPDRLPTSRALNQGWARAHQAVVDRAALTLRDDFRAGLDDWMNREGARPSWNSDAAGFVHPAALALYRPSLGLDDYRMQFVGTIDKKALSWVVRAADFNNYYVVRLSILKPGPVPAIGVTRYAVINGVTQNPVTKPLLMSARLDTVYRVSLDVRGGHFALSVQDQPVDSWSEPTLRKGGIGFFSEHDAGSRIAAVQVRGQDDLLGRLCAFLAPSGVASYRASLSEQAALTITPEMTVRNAGRGGLVSSPPAYGRRLPRGTARLDPAVWQVPEVNLPNAKRCGPGSGRVGGGRSRRGSTGASSSTCY